MGFLAPPTYILAVVVLAFGGIPKGQIFPSEPTQSHTHTSLQVMMRAGLVLV